MMIWAWIGAAAVGLSLGLLGSGGAILTVPILVYLVGHDEKRAIAESLAIVGAIALAGVLRAAMQQRVDFRSAALLAFPGIAGTYLGASVAKFMPGALQLLLLAVLMLTASVLMFRNGHSEPHAPRGRRNASAFAMIAAQGFGLGVITGLVGVGGGFLIVPVLVLLLRLPMSVAVGTSLAIIAVNSATGFLKYLAVMAETAGISPNSPQVDWKVIGLFSLVGIAGSLVGASLAGWIRQETLKRMFAVFLIAMAGFILVRETPRVASKAPEHSPAASVQATIGTPAAPPASQ